MKPARVDPNVSYVPPMPRMSAPPVAVKAMVSRVREADLDALGDWLLPKLAERWPAIMDRNGEARGPVYAWLRSLTGSNAMLFCKSENACGLFYFERDELTSPHGEVRERFVKSRKEATTAEHAAIYKTAKEWAVSLKAARMVFGLESDASISGTVMPAIGTLTTPIEKQSIYSIELIPAP